VRRADSKELKRVFVSPKTHFVLISGSSTWGELRRNEGSLRNWRFTVCRREIAWRSPMWSSTRPAGASANCRSRWTSYYDHFGRYVICWPAREASAIAPLVGLTNTATPSTNWAFMAAPLSATTAEALAPKSISLRLNRSIAG
jgi:hypothetical protein